MADTCARTHSNIPTCTTWQHLLVCALQDQRQRFQDPRQSFQDPQQVPQTLLQQVPEALMQEIPQAEPVAHIALAEAAIIAGDLWAQGVPRLVSGGLQTLHFIAIRESGSSFS